MARADSSNFPNEPLRMCHQNDQAHCFRISIDVQGDKVRGFIIYKRDYVSVTLLCHIYDLAMRKI
jgi:hypothetical protein